MNLSLGEKEYVVLIDGERFLIEDPKPLGRQLLDKAGKRPVEEHVVLTFLDNGLLEVIGLDEIIDICKAGIMEFLTFKTDRIFRFVLDGRSFPWGANLISGLQLKKLARVDPEEYEVWLEARGQDEDRLINNAETVDLSPNSLERFFVIQRQDSRVKIFINEKPIIVIGYEHTGLDIKQAAIDQGVNIQLDFILSVELGPGRTKIVADSEMVKVQRGQKFIAIANDDNS